MDSLRYDRLCRTPSSEAYLLSDGDEPIGRAELHFTSSVVYGLLVLEGEREEDEVLDIIERLDDDLVWSADVAREDFIVTVYQGREVGVYSDPREGGEDEDDAEDEEEEGENGDRQGISVQRGR
jgi:hypothetical protein